MRGHKASLIYQDARLKAGRQAQWPSTGDGMDAATLSHLMGWIDSNTRWRVRAAAHRVVHGGQRREVAALVDASLIREMQALTPMAPLHQPLCLAPMLHLAANIPRCLRWPVSTPRFTTPSIRWKPCTGCPGP
ncbi:hypothetical protein QNM99_03165 [Pseudomonas sp. PCH446]